MIPKNLPDELKTMRRWVCVGADKVPMQATCRMAASSSNPDTWSDFETACAAVEAGYYDYVGFVFADDGIVGIDIDKGYIGRFISPIANDIIKSCDSYTERSRSGRGMHILVKGTIPFRGRNNGDGVEIYRTGRYFICTGDEIVKKPISSNQKALNYVIGKYFPDLVKNSENESLRRIYNPIYRKPQNGRIFIRPEYPPIEKGCRNQSIASLAGYLHTCGLCPEDVLWECLQCNHDACRPELSAQEVMRTVESICSYQR